MFNPLPAQNQERPLAVSHPQFRYPAPKNPYSSKIARLRTNSPNLVYSDHEAEENAGQWKTKMLTQPGPLHVEVGCNCGHVSLEWAARNPENSYIGIDWKFKPIFRGAEKADRRGIKNLSLIRAHAERLPYIFGKNEVDFLYLFFPDPWPKTAHWKNRFINAERLRAIAPIMKPNGIFHIKTDHDGYFKWMLKAVSEVQDCWSIVKMSKNLHENHPAPETLRIPDVTLFESLFIKDGIPIKSIWLKPKL